MAYKLNLTGEEFEYKIKNPQPVNLLDNSDFTNPVNQRGQTTYAASGYTIDRWIASSTQPVSISSSGITLNGTNGVIVLRQRFTNLKDGIYTVAVKVGDYINVRQYQKEGTTYTRIYTNSSYDGGYLQLIHNTYPEFQIRANSGSIVTVEWAAVYEGAYTEANLPTYQPKNYSTELLECQRYFYRVPSEAKTSYTGYIFDSTTLRVTIPLPVPMRTTPTLNVTNSANITAYGNSTIRIDTIAVGTLDKNACSLQCNGSFSEIGISVAMRFNTEVTLSADL